MQDKPISILRLLGIMFSMLAAIYCFLWIASSDIRKAGEIFLHELSAGEISTARAMLGPELSKEWSEEQLTRKFGQMEPFSDIGFMLVGIKGVSSTMNITGTAETASGCVGIVYLSFDVSWRFENRGIEDFDIDTNCTRQ